MVTKPTQEEWDDISFVAASAYRETVLKQLAAGPATPSQIQAERDITLSHTSRALRQLRERSLVELLVSEDRRKGRFYGITDRGADLWGMVKEMDDEPTVMTDGGVVEESSELKNQDDVPAFVDPNAENTVCHFCGQTWEPTVVDGFDLSAEDEYYPKMVPVCPEHAGGCR